MNVKNLNVIDKEHSFLTHKHQNSINGYKECIDEFALNLKKEITLDSSTPIFLDANVFLRYYSISFAAREKLFDFIKSKIDRIVLSSQIQYEYLKNREDVIQRFFEQVTNKIPKDFKSDIVNKMQSFLDQHKVVLKDYSFVETKILKYQANLESLLDELNEAVNTKKKEYKDLIINDKLMNLLASCKQTITLNEEEKNLVVRDFDALRKEVASSIDNIINKPNAVFPGAGDIKEKPDAPYGDYIIYHEIMKFMLENKTNVIFLTFDNSKGDWMGKNKTTHLHYVQNMYANTKKILYILDAERALENLLNVDINSLVEDTPLGALSVESLNDFIKICPIFYGRKLVDIEDSFILELKANGYHYISEIDAVFTDNMEKLLHNLSLGKHKHLNIKGVVRHSLGLLNPSYRILESKKRNTMDSEQKEEERRRKKF